MVPGAKGRLPALGLLLVLLVCVCISPGAGTAGSLSERLFIKLDRLRSRPLFLAGEAELGDRWRPALIVAAACRDDSEGERGLGGA